MQVEVEVFAGPLDGEKLSLSDAFDGACAVIPRANKAGEPAAYLYRATEGPQGLKLIFVGYTMTFEPYTEYRLQCAACSAEAEHQLVPRSLGFPLPCSSCGRSTLWPKK